jgi:hypothetical protein
MELSAVFRPRNEQAISAFFSGGHASSFDAPEANKQWKSMKRHRQMPIS